MAQKTLAENMHDSNRIGLDLMIIDARLAHTLLDMAEHSTTDKDRFRQIGEAHRAYESILVFLDRLQPDEQQAPILQQEFERLRQRLREAGASPV